ncbi:MAG TPA: hypothetical protein VJH33_02790 [Candidatus Paceibacterota bacterium]
MGSVFFVIGLLIAAYLGILAAPKGKGLFGAVVLMMVWWMIFTIIA